MKIQRIKSLTYKSDIFFQPVLYSKPQDLTILPLNLASVTHFVKFLEFLHQRDSYLPPMLLSISLSFYLNTQWDDEQQRVRTRLFTKNQLKKTYDQLKDREACQKCFVEDQQQIERYVEGVVRRVYDEGVNGIEESDILRNHGGVGTSLRFR